MTEMAVVALKNATRNRKNENENPGAAAFRHSWLSGPQWLTDCAVSHLHSSPRDASLCPYSHPPIVFYFLATPSRYLSSTIVFLSFPYMSEQPLPSAPVCLFQTCSKNTTNSYTACWCFPQSIISIRRGCQCEANGSAPRFYLGSRFMAGCERGIYSPLAQCQPGTGRAQRDETSSSFINGAGASTSQRRTRRCKPTIVNELPFSFFHFGSDILS